MVKRRARRTIGVALAVGLLSMVPAPLLAQAMSEEEAEELRALTRDPTRRLYSEPPRLPLVRRTLDRAAIRRFAATVSVARIVETFPGVRAAGGNDPLAEVVIRGLGGGRVRNLDRGLPVADFEVPGLDGPGIDPADADRVVVTSGTDATLSGAGAIGGAIEIGTPAGESGDWARRPIEGALYGSSADRGAGAAVRMPAGGLLGGGVRGSRDFWDGEVVLSGRRSGAVATPAGRIDPLDADVFQGSAAIRIATPTANAGLRLARFSGPFDRPGVSPGGIERDLDDRRVQWSGGYATGGVDFQMRGQFQQRRLDVSEPGAGVGAMAMRLEGTHLEIFARGEGARGSWMLGVSGLTQNTETRSAHRVRPDARVISGAVFGTERLTLGRWTATAAARLDVRNLEASHDPTIAIPTLQRSFDATTGGVGVEWQALEPLALTLAVGSGWRMPSLYELYANGRLPGGDRYDLGDRRLDLERGVTVDVGARWSRDRVRGELRVFRQWVDGFVGRETTGEVLDGLRVRRFVAHDAALLGAETALEADLSERLRLIAGGDAVSGQDVTRDRPLAGVPPPRLRLEAELRGTPAPWLAGARVRIGVEGHGRTTRLTPGATPAAPLALVHLEGEAAWRNLTVGVRIDNLTDVRARHFLADDSVVGRYRGRGAVMALGWSR